MTALTNTAIDALQPGGELKDDRVPGLSVRANKTGKSFMLYYRTKSGIPRRPKIGDCSVVSLSDARDIARQWLAQVAGGGDPAGKFKAMRAEATIDDLWTRCAKEHYNDPEKDWHRSAKWLYKNQMANLKIGGTRFGSYRVSAVDIEAAMELHKKLSARPVQANRCIAVLGKMLDLAENWKLRPVQTNPCPNVQRNPERKRKRYAKTGELAAIGAELQKYADDPVHLTGVAFLYILLFTGARPREIERASPDILERHVKREEDGTMKVYGVLRIDDGKTGQRDVFLPPQAMEVIDRLPARRERLTGRAHMPRRLWWKIREAVGCDDLWARDSRRTFATVGYSSGVDKKVMGNLLGHASPATTEVYAKLMEDPAHAAAAATAAEVERLLKGK